MGLVSAVTLVYNTEALVQYAIKPVLPYVDEYVIVNGSPEGPSTDLTWYLIKQLDSSKIKYFEGIYGQAGKIDNWDIVQHNFAFSHCIGEWIWKVDADEIYDEYAVRSVVRACRNAEDYDYLQWPNLYFVRDTNHIRYVPPPIRCWRNIPGTRFVDLSVTPVVDEYHIQVVRRGRWLSDVATYHYGFILPYRRQWQRIHKFIQREDNEDAKARPRVHIEAHLRDAWDLRRNQILSYQSSHPKPIRDALFYNRGENLANLTFGIYTTGKYDDVEDVGGSELSLALCLKEFRRRGIVCSINSSDFVDVFITFRENIDPNTINAKVKIWWSCDQYPTNAEEITQNANGYDLIFAISEYHKEYLSSIGIEATKIKVINLGIDREDYEQIEEKNKNQLIYCSQPDRGLKYLARIFQIIHEQVPDVTLVITCDKTLWGLKDPGNVPEKKLFKHIPNVSFLGKVSRKKLIELQKQSEIMVFPCDYGELFCISAIECQAAGCAIVSTNIAALPETVPVGYVGNLFDGNPSTEEYFELFAQYVISLLTDQRKTLETFQEQARQRALQLYTWEDLVYEMSFYIDIVWRLKENEKKICQ